MSAYGRRLSSRQRLEPPIEARLTLCGGDVVSGWIVDEQDDGLGMVFGSMDAKRLVEHTDCCVLGAVDLQLLDGGDAGPVVPMRLAHATPGEREGSCRAGLTFDVGRMKPEDVTYLLGVWRRMLARTVQS